MRIAARVATLLTISVAMGAAAQAPRAPTASLHDTLERQRMESATALVRAGDCARAEAYALRQKSAEVVAAVTRLCSAQAVAAPRPGDLDGEVTAFAADPRHPLFPLVRADMAQLVREGRAATLQQAYDLAIARRAAAAQAVAAPPPPR